MAALRNSARKKRLLSPRIELELPLLGALLLLTW